jgi:hypothetical protein
VEKGVSQTRVSRALTVTFNIGSAHVRQTTKDAGLILGLPPLARIAHKVLMKGIPPSLASEIGVVWGVF